MDILIIILKTLIYYILLYISSMNSILVQCSSVKLVKRNNHENISQLLDNLLRGYDNSIRPGFGGPPAIIEVDIMVRSMGPISEVDMTYSMDCYFRQSWVDKRLAFRGAQDTLALSITMLAKIWKPDTYFYNGKQSYLHTITTPNKFVRIYQNGRVLYSSRLTIKAGCPMYLEDFPMDIQKCPLKFGSFGYTTSDIIYRWNHARQAVAIADDMKLSQFDLVDCPVGNVTDIVKKSLMPIKGNKVSKTIETTQYSMLIVSFHLKRHMGNFLIQVYGPCCLLVVLSWVSFWLNREATADRVSLGITTVLTMTFLGLEARTDLPKVPYPTALDFFVFLSFGFIFATIIQFAVVHYFTKYGSGECYYFINDYDSDSDIEDDNKVLDTYDSLPNKLNQNTDMKLFEVIPLTACSVPVSPESKSRRSSTIGWKNNRKKITDEENIESLEEKSDSTHITFNQSNRQYRRRRKREQQLNSVSKIDRASRIVFPLLFLIINVIYWCAYLSRSTRLSTIPITKS